MTCYITAACILHVLHSLSHASSTAVMANTQQSDTLIEEGRFNTLVKESNSCIQLNYKLMCIKCSYINLALSACA